MTYLIAAIAALVLSLAYLKGRHDGAVAPKEELAVLGAKSEAQKDRYEEVVKRLSVSVLRMHEAATYRAQDAQRVIRAAPARYRVACLDGDGLRVANDALTNRAGGAADAVPDASATH